MLQFYKLECFYTNLILLNYKNKKLDMVFIIKPLGAVLAEDHDWFGKSDPYCIIHIGGKKFQTKPHNGAGKYPKWSEVFTFDGNANELKVQVYDDDIGKDDYYAEGRLNLCGWLSHPGQAQTGSVDILLKNKKTGVLTINVEYQGQGNQGEWEFHQINSINKTLVAIQTIQAPRILKYKIKRK